jgi:hypothetical protein
MGQYGPAGMIFKGMAFDPKQRGMLEETFDLLEKALTVLKGEHFEAWLLLHGPYIGDPGDLALDLALVEMWREKKPGLAKWHDFGIEKLAEYLKDQDLYVLFPKRMTSREEKHVDKRNDELFSLYRIFKHEDGMSRNKAIETAADHCGYSRSRAYEIVNLREGKPA